MSGLERLVAQGFTGLAAVFIFCVMALHAVAIVELRRLGDTSVSLFSPVLPLVLPTILVLGAIALVRSKRYWLSLVLAVPSATIAAFYLLVQLASRAG